MTKCLMIGIVSGLVNAQIVPTFKALSRRLKNSLRRYLESFAQPNIQLKSLSIGTKLCNNYTAQAEYYNRAARAEEALNSVLC